MPRIRALPPTRGTTLDALASEGLAIALDQLGSPAFIADERGRPVYASASGAEMLDRDPAGVIERLKCQIDRRDPDVREIRAPGHGRHWLVVLSHRGATPTEQAEVVARAWALSPRQVEVVRLAATGVANKTIARELECAEGTVELHMTAIFRKANVESRAQLIARFWTLTSRGDPRRGLY